MTTWDYLWWWVGYGVTAQASGIDFCTLDGAAKVGETLHDLGSRGWELVSVAPTGVRGPNSELLWVFKRPRKE